ncbi:hypothetical protein [Vibrio navarrensis]|uniref:hypothetical protein n=1 Tax=Vibrio navarrensis TaxID=29495 RepID=UPI0018DB9D57|nr:hypothetical protein [Vibrio navarrensis]MBH9740038.1 hypothetical protein [Vibrio navarrensis]
MRLRCKNTILAVTIAMMSGCVIANDTITYSELQEKRGLSIEKDGALKEAEFELLNLEQQKKKAAIELELEKLKIEKDKLAQPTQEGGKNPSIPKNPLGNTPDLKINPLDNAYYDAVNSYIDTLENQVFWVEVSRLAGRIDGGFMVNGAVEYATIGEIINHTWLVKELTMNHAVLVDTTKTKQRSAETRLALTSYTEAIQQSKESKQMKKMLVESHISNAVAMGNMGQQAPLLINDSPQAGLLYK